MQAAAEAEEELRRRQPGLDTDDVCVESGRMFGGCFASVRLPPTTACFPDARSERWVGRQLRALQGWKRVPPSSRCAMSRPRGTHGLRTTHVTLEPSLEPSCRRSSVNVGKSRDDGVNVEGWDGEAHRLPFPILPRRGDSRQRQNSRVGYHSGRWGSSAACAEGNLRPQRQRNLPSRGITAPNYPRPGLSPCRKALISS